MRAASNCNSIAMAGHAGPIGRRADAASHAAAERFTERLLHAAAPLAATLRAWHRRMHTRAELREMDRRMLDDVGLSRSQAGIEASKWFWQA